MKRLTTTVVNIDDDLASDVYKRQIPVLIELFPHVKIYESTLVIEPHDEYRGIVAVLEFEYENLDQSQHKNASRAFHDAVNGIIRMQLWRTPAARVISETGTI